ncbi:MAG: oligosaccharide flippase family protein [Chloroflexi bacterium]|nr:oligosaccharide flippase family protein [Chloroflexota bacterium]
MSTDVAASRATSSPRLILKNIASLSASGIVERLLALVAGIFARRALGPTAIGAYSWAAAVASYPALFVNGGFGTIAKRDTAREPSQAVQR